VGLDFNCADKLAVADLWASFSGVTGATFNGCTVQLDIQGGTAAAPPDWWDLGNATADANNCSAGRIANATVSAGAATFCGSPYAAAAQQGGANITTSGNIIRVVSDWVPVGGAPLGAAGTGGWAAQHLSINNNPFGGFPSHALCVGCLTPACIVLNGISVAIDGVNTLYETPGLRNFVTWGGGNGGCPGATPTRNATWGQVKALYR
jgi:hypothetical protein